MASTEKWQRLENETDKAYSAFCVYRDLGIKRSLRLATKELETISNKETKSKFNIITKRKLTKLKRKR